MKKRNASFRGSSESPLTRARDGSLDLVLFRFLSSFRMTDVLVRSCWGRFSSGRVSLLGIVTMACPEDIAPDVLASTAIISHWMSVEDENR